MTTSLATPTPTAAERVQQAVAERASTDYTFHFWTAFGWTVLTFGLYAFYVFYQLMRRSRDHNRRRVALLGAAQDVAWQHAVERGKSETLRPAFEQVQADIEPLRAMDGDLRDPAIWLLISIVGGGLVWLAGALLLDQDLVRHERQERAAEDGLTRLFSELGVQLPTPVPAAKQPHNYVSRVLALVFTFGLYSLWWVADLMREGNANFRQDCEWEDALWQSLGGAANGSS